jgi:hypothetical protein
MSANTEQRKLAAIMFMDMVGFDVGNRESRNAGGSLHDSLEWSFPDLSSL